MVQRILSDIQRDVKQLIGDVAALRKLEPARYVDERFGVPTITDILRELEKPGRDPRPEFKTATFRDGIESMKDLQPGMQLEGVVTNVTNFGAFVDIGVHQDGLVHISAMSDKFIKDPREVVKAGDVVRVKVVEVDEQRKRIALTMKTQETPARSARAEKTEARRPTQRPDSKPRVAPQPAASPMGNALALAMERARRK